MSFFFAGISFLIYIFFYLHPLFQEHNLGVKQGFGVYWKYELRSALLGFYNV